MRNRFDTELEELSRCLILMGNLCEKAIANISNALKNGDLELANKVIHEDEEIDRMEKEIETKCLKLLLQQQPVARDLRQISAALKMITDMERIGDQTADIAEIMISAGMSEVRNIEPILVMAKEVSLMIHDSVMAYVNKDLELAYKVMKADDKVDSLFDTIKEEIVKYIKESHGDNGIATIDIIMITKYLERIGDHATNIAEWVEFSITGVHRDSAAM